MFAELKNSMLIVLGFISSGSPSTWLSSYYHDDHDDHDDDNVDGVDDAYEDQCDDEVDLNYDDHDQNDE